MIISLTVMQVIATIMDVMPNVGLLVATLEALGMVDDFRKEPVSSFKETYIPVLTRGNTSSASICISSSTIDWGIPGYCTPITK